MQKTKILHLISGNIFSGLEKVASDIVKKMDAYYDQSLCIVKGPIEDSVKGIGIKYFSIPTFSLPEIIKVMNIFKPQIIHAHDYRASVLAALMPYTRVKIISHLHNNNPWAMKLNGKTLIYAAILPRLDKILAVSSSVINEHILHNFLEPKSFVLANSVNLRKIISDSRVTIAEESDIVIVGRLEEQKAPLEALSIISEIKKRKSDIKVLMVGDGSLRSACEKTIERLELTSTVRMLGFSSNPYPYMRNSKLLMLTSNWEGFGLVVLEAMALGKPVLAKPVGGVINLVKNGETGYICNDHQDFIRRALAILETDERHWAISCSHWAKELNNNSYYETLSTIYESCMLS